MSELSAQRIPGSFVRETTDGRLVGVDHYGHILWLGDDGGRSDLWSYKTQSEALDAMFIWEPGTIAICALCGREQGGDDPPGNWIRHQPSNRRRLPIYDATRAGIIGWLHYVRE